MSAGHAASREAGALAAEFAEKADAATAGPWWGGGGTVLAERGQFTVQAVACNLTPADTAFVAFCGEHREVLAAALRRYAATPEPAADGAFTEEERAEPGTVQALIAELRSDADFMEQRFGGSCEPERSEIANHRAAADALAASESRALRAEAHAAEALRLLNAFAEDGGVVGFGEIIKDTVVEVLATKLAASERRAAQSDAIAARVLAEDADRDADLALAIAVADDCRCADADLPCERHQRIARAVLATLRGDTP